MSTVNEILQLAAERDIPVSKIESGYYIARAKVYILCKCDGNGTLGESTCDCGAKVHCCVFCAEDGRIRRCPNCQSDRKRTVRRLGDAWNRRLEEAANELGVPGEIAEKVKNEYSMTREEVMEVWSRSDRLYAKPVDIDQLIAEEKLERVTHVPNWVPGRVWLPPLPNMTIARFKLLVDESELPEHVQGRIVRRYTNPVNDVVVETIIELDL